MTTLGVAVVLMSLGFLVGFLFWAAVKLKSEPENKRQP